MKTLHTLQASQTGSAVSALEGETEGVRRTSGVSASAGGRVANGSFSAPDPEVPEKKLRRKFTVVYKLRILQEADQCNGPGEIGALLRREGLYSSNLTTWRRQREDGILQSLRPKKRGRKAKPDDPAAQRLSQLEKENQRLKNQLRKAEIIIEAQKKISELLGIDQNPEDREESK